MQLTVVVENQTSSQNLLAEWGYSAWLQTEDAVILLDTGGIQHTLQHNLTALGLNARRITDLVLSHGHFDHTSGVMDVLRLGQLPASDASALETQTPNELPAAVRCSQDLPFRRSIRSLKSLRA